MTANVQARHAWVPHTRNRRQCRLDPRSLRHNTADDMPNVRPRGTKPRNLVLVAALLLGCGAKQGGAKGASNGDDDGPLDPKQFSTRPVDEACEGLKFGMTSEQALAHLKQKGYEVPMMLTATRSAQDLVLRQDDLDGSALYYDLLPDDGSLEPRPEPLRLRASFSEQGGGLDWCATVYDPDPARYQRFAAAFNSQFPGKARIHHDGEELHWSDGKVSIALTTDGVETRIALRREDDPPGNPLQGALPPWRPQKTGSFVDHETRYRLKPRDRDEFAERFRARGRKQKLSEDEIEARFEQRMLSYTEALSSIYQPDTLVTITPDTLKWGEHQQRYEVLRRHGYFTQVRITEGLDAGSQCVFYTKDVNLLLPAGKCFGGKTFRLEKVADQDGDEKQ